tara:strand:+ start:529 stop:1095 length:567 start_codon:yes stop_codon:yes gene_type:complete
MKQGDTADRRKTLNDALARIASGSSEALHELYEATSPKIFGVVIRILRDRARAEDLLQEVYLTVWQRAGRFDPKKGSAMTWLCTIARNTALNELRKSKRDRNLTEDPFPDVGVKDIVPADEWLCEVEDSKALLRCLDELDSKQRSSITLAFFDGLSHSELANKLGSPLGTVKSWIRRGLADLRGCLGG